MRARTGPAVGPGIKCIICRMTSAGKRSMVREGRRTKVITGEIALAQPEGGPIGECKARGSYRKEGRHRRRRRRRRSREAEAGGSQGVATRHSRLAFRRLCLLPSRLGVYGVKAYGVKA